MCGELVPDEHEHVVNTESRIAHVHVPGLLAAVHEQRCRRRQVPRRPGPLPVARPELSIAPGAWDELQIPVSVAFFFVNSSHRLGRRLLPESRRVRPSRSCPLDAWDRLVADNAVLGTMEPDVEALFVRRDAEHGGAFLVPIDACYELVGELRRLWKGFDGGHRGARGDGRVLRTAPRSDPR